MPTARSFRRVASFASIGLALLLVASSAPAQRRARRRATPVPGRTAQGAITSPAAPSAPSAVAVEIAVGGDHSCARTSDGRVLCWGNDVILTLLAPRTSILGPRATPTPVARVHDATELALHGSQALVRLAGDRLISTGTWDIERLGTRAHSPEDWQTDALELANVPPLRLVPSASGQTICAIHPDQTMRCRGDNQYGQLGAGSELVGTEDWLAVELPHVASASHGGQTGCAITTDGALFCFGRGLYGVLGDGTTTPVARRPVRVAGLPRAEAVAVSRRGHACAIEAGGAVACWGRGVEGQLGNARIVDEAAPVRVSLPGPASAIAVGQHASCAIVLGRALCWGAGNEGQLGDGQRRGSSTPTPVSNLDHLTAIALGDAHACALRDDGSVWCWGRNTEGSCGVPAGTDTTVPVRVALP